MICDLCKGKGWVQGQAPGISTACSACGGKGFVEQTHFEYMQSCSIEELAKIIFDFYLSGYIAKEPPLIDEGVKQAEMWLKQPHTIKE